VPHAGEEIERDPSHEGSGVKKSVAQNGQLMADKTYFAPSEGYKSSAQGAGREKPKAVI